MNVSFKVRVLSVGLAAVFGLAACSPAGSTLTPVATQLEEAEVFATEMVSTEMVSTEMVATEMVATEMVPTESLATAAPTEGAMTPEVTTEATVAATMAPNEEGQPNLLLSTELIGSQIVDLEGNNIGDVMEILVDHAGLVHTVVFDANDYLADNDVAATPNADALNVGIVAAPLSAFKVNYTMNTDAEINEEQVLVYQGTPADLVTMTGFDLSVFDQDGFIINTADTSLDAAFNGLIRVSEFSDWNLLNAANEDVGEVENLVIDLNQEKVVFGVVDFGGFLGIGEQSTIVPWELFTVEQNADTDTHFQLDVTQATLENSPVVDLGAWPTWFERVDTNTDWNMNWQSDAQTFWEAAATN